jgi:hypothetical protein
MLRQGSVRTAIAWTKHKLRRGLSHETRDIKSKPRERPPAAQTFDATEHRVAVLEDAARRAETFDPPPRATTGRQTRIDEHLSHDQKKALDDLLSTRNTRSR